MTGSTITRDESYTPIDSSVPIADILKVSQTARRQDEGAGLRVGNRSEFTLVADVVQPDGASRFRERASKAQAEAAYWEGRLGTVHDLRIVLINDDKQFLFAATYSDDFKPYVADVAKFATPWIDYMFMGVAEGFPGMASPDALEYLAAHQVEAQVWYGSPNPDATPRDITRSLQVSGAVDALLDAVQG